MGQRITTIDAGEELLPLSMPGEEAVDIRIKGLPLFEAVIKANLALLEATEVM